jgi:hypothetical protein
LALSEYLRSPKIFFPKAFDAKKGEEIVKVLSKKESRFLDGLVSYWQPQWSTTLAYGGDTSALNAQLADLSRVPGMRVKVTLAPDLAKEVGTGHQVGNWWVKYKHTAPDVLEVRINLASKELDFGKLELWQASAKE